MNEWMFELDTVVDLVIGGRGVITMRGEDGEGEKYYVQTPEGSGNWWKPGFLRKVE